MKKRFMIYIVALVFAAVSTGCSVNEEGIMGSFPYLEVELESKTLTKTASTDAIAIKTNRLISVSVVPASSWLAAVVDGEQLVLSWEANELEIPREATITLSTSNFLIAKTIKVVQDASGELTFDGDLILRSKEEIAANTYTKTTGDLVIGNVTSIVSKSTDNSVSVDINGKTVTASPSDISDEDMDLLEEQIHMIGGKGLAVVNTQVTELPLEIIAANGVEKLGFDYNAIEELPSAETMESLGLKELSLKGNDISDISALAGCTTIESLDLTGNDVYDLEPLMSMTGLQDVVLTDLPLTQAQVEVFREQTGLNVVADNVRQDESPLPVFGNVVITEVSDTEVIITAQVTNDASGVTKAGFYVGNERSLAGMTSHDAVYSDGTLTLTFHPETLTNKVWYVRAYAENAAGVNYSKVGVFGSLFYYEDVYLRNALDIQNLVENKYSHIEGSVLVGDMSSAGEGVRLDDGRFSLYFAPSTFDDLSVLNQIAYVRDGLYIGNVGMSNTDYISHISGMTTLWLRGNKISSIPAMDSDATLTYLDVSMNSLKDFSFLDRMPLLENLYLGTSDNPSSETNDIGLLTGLEKYTNLKKIDLSGLPIHEWQVSDLRVLMPQTEIVFRSGGRDPWIPTVVSRGVERMENSAVLNGCITSQGTSEITEYGFYFGTDLDNLQKVKIGTSMEEGSVFSHEVNANMEDTYYFYPYAVNQYGESRTRVDKFELGSIDLSQYETANCYIITAPGSYMFNATVKGNSSESVGDAVSAEVIWETKNTDISVSSGEIITDVHYVAPNISFEIPEPFTPGNALVAVKDASGTILWSWHIWVTDFEPDETAQTYLSGAVMMDRNLGALDAGTTETAYGLLYQWGRKDPFINAKDVKLTGYAITAPDDVLNHVDKNDDNDNLQFTIANPTTVVDGSTWNRDNSLWTQDKTMYDPCPAGWEVPDGGPGAWLDFNTECRYGDGGVWFDEPLSTPAAYYPNAGFTDGSKTLRDANSAHYWSSTLSGSTAYNFCINWRGLPYENSHVDCQFSVRCQQSEAGYAVEIVGVVGESEGSVTVKGSVSVVRDADIYEIGIVSSTTNDYPTLESNESKIQSSSTSTGEFQCTLTGVRSQTKYYIRPYVVGDKGVKYGSVMEYVVRTPSNGEGFTGDDFEW